MKTIFHSFLSDSTGRIITQGIQLLMSIYFARILPVDAFGQLAFLISVSAIIQTLAEFNLPNFIVYDQSYISINRYLLTSSLFYLFLSLILIFIFKEVYQYWWFILIFGILNIYVNYIRAIYYVESWLFEYNTKYVISITISSIIFVFIGLVYNSIILILFYNLFSLLIMVTVSRNKIDKDFFRLETILGFTEKEKEYIKGFYLANLFNIAGSNAENIVLKKIVGVSNLGLFNRAKSVEAMVTNSFLQSISFVFFTKLSVFNTRDSKLGLNMHIRLSFIIFLILGILCGLFVYLIGPSIVLTIYGDDYNYSGQLVKYLSFIIPSVFMYTWLNMILSVQGNGAFFAKINIVKTITFSLLLCTLLYVDLLYYLMCLSFLYFLLTLVSLILYYFLFYVRNQTI